MPASYAHYRFGKMLIPGLPADVRQTVQRFRRMYDMGLQGPDFFFYDGAILGASGKPLGSRFHRQSGREFFSAACRAATSDAAKAYLYGLLGHYCLDSVCHPFVNRLVSIGEAGHIPLESEFERYLLVLDGEDEPQSYDMSRVFRLTRGECMTVSGFYPGSGGAMVARGIRAMAHCAKLLARPADQWQTRLLLKISPELLEHRIPALEDPGLAPYVRELGELYDQALDHYGSMLSGLTAHLREAAPLGEEFAPDFG